MPDPVLTDPKVLPPQSWTLIVFCYNEEGSVLRVLESSLRVLDRIAPGRHELLVVDDGSSDSSPSLIREFTQRHPQARALFHPRNLGIGEALRSGYSSARFENVCAVPADGQFALEELIPFPEVGPGSFVSFFRETQPGYGPFRILLSLANRAVNRYFLGIRLKDVNWVKIYKREDLQVLDLKLRSSLVESEICAKLFRLGRSCREIPSQYLGRTGGRAKGASIKTLWRAFRETLQLITAVQAFRPRAE